MERSQLISRLVSDMLDTLRNLEQHDNELYAEQICRQGFRRFENMTTKELRTQYCVAFGEEAA